ncbi:hypothetical protein F1188_00885 [Roseospira marina]|uniref:EAL domain-containing protein n=1 Tax=Roseospira marina TaxID=140057 RepID=A0A5M6IGF5_9PROT|nr:hypothetical protein [Roseospira marina]KAA5607353.1 hypothetical protein F1188_00885 [Roseospira marina]MBB4312480.1 EAL domain-containing protein (putative c-di-GMP-specific phosphodiesterase class I) [Roseospira marina]MBB5085504.1 EAL domain-containing protein (putative c-di-GMP-specific phosphodiesterase class I) [Roseospira marina]
MADTPMIRSGFMLPDYAREIATTHLGLRILRLNVSELRPENREDDVLRSLEAALRPLVRGGTARIFRMPEGDYILAFHKDQTDRVRALLVRLRFLVQDDPLADHFGDPAERNSPLLHWWRLEDDFPKLRALAVALEDEAIRRAEAMAHRDGTRAGSATVNATHAAAEADERRVTLRLGANAEASTAPGTASGPAPVGSPGGAPSSSTSPPAAGSSEEPDWRPIGATGPAAASARGRDSRETQARRPIDLDILDRLVNGVARADLANHVRRQTVCALVGNAPPQPVFSEIYVSIPELRDTIAPNVDLAANRWLFQHFTETLDRRILAWLNQGGGRPTQAGFSININVDTILSENFLRFEQVIAAGIHGTVILELRVEDVFADLEAFAFARDFIHQRGYRLCLDFLTPDTLALLDRQRLGVDLLKLFWRPDLPHHLDTPAGRTVVDRLKRGEGGRTILCRCDDAAAVTLGRSIGITMFQGRHIDDLTSIVDGPVAPDAWP